MPVARELVRLAVVGDARVAADDDGSAIGRELLARRGGAASTCRRRSGATRAARSPSSREKVIPSKSLFAP